MVAGAGCQGQSVRELRQGCDQSQGGADKKNMCRFYRYRFLKMDLGKSFKFSASSLGSGLSGTNSQADAGKLTPAVLLCI